MPSENEGNEEKGFFQKILLRRSKSGGSSGSSGGNKKVWSPRRKSKRQPKASTSNGDKSKPVQNGRRVVRATRPPSPTTEMSSIVSSEQDATEVNPTSSAAMRGGNNLPTIQNENLREKTEEWRQKRMDATVANQKENKEKEIKQHRLKPMVKTVDDVEGVGKEGKDSNKNSVDKKIADIEVSDIFKTRTFHPEHKRKADSYDPVEKKKKLDEVDQSAESDKEGGAVAKPSNKAKVPGWLNIVLPAAFVATCAVIMMKALRKK